MKMIKTQIYDEKQQKNAEKGYKSIKYHFLRTRPTDP